MEEDKKNKVGKVCINIFLFVMILCVFTYFYAKYFGTEGVVVREYKVSSEKIPQNFSGIKIIHFSDLLYETNNDLHNIEKMVEKMNILKPDIVLFTGGIVKDDKKIKENESKKIINILSKIDSKLGKYAVKGNEDSKNISIITESGFKLLENGYDIIYNETNDPIFVGGVSSYLTKEYDFNKAFEYFSTPEVNDLYKILLVHEGDTINELEKTDYKADLILGGHSLNGSVIIPYYGSLYIPKGSKKYYGKHYLLDKTEVFISGGIGTNIYDLRLFNKPSVNLYRLKSLQ